MIDAKKSRTDYSHLLPEIKSFLGEDGLNFFRKLKKDHKQINCVFVDHGIPHVVHFREGMQVRNKLRELTNNSWSTYEYDNTWVDIIEDCL